MDYTEKMTKSHNQIEGKTIKKLFLFMLTFIATFAMICAVSQSKTVKTRADSAVSYMAWDDTSKTVKSVDGGCTTYTVIDRNTSSWSDGWYVLNSNVSISSRIVVSGTVNLILQDGFTLSADDGVTVTTDNTLNIYGQALGTGKLWVTDTPAMASGIGGGNNESCGTVNIHGGTVTTMSYNLGAGIGGGMYGKGGNITIYGGTIQSQGGNRGAGIGGGSNSDGGTVTIYGGYVTANGGGDAAGIGGGMYGNGGTLTINGGIIVANGGQVGIGSGRLNNDGINFTLNAELVRVDIGKKTVFTTMAPITLNANGGTINSGDMTEYPQAAGTALPTDITKTDFVFAGWYDNAELTGTVYKNIPAEKRGEISYWAKYDRPIRYNLNEGKINGTYPTSYSEGTEVTLPTNITREGYTFNGWYDNASLTGDAITAVGIEETGVKEYWAKWDPNIIYNNLNGATINGDYPTYYVEGLGLTLPTDVTREGSTFLGWYDNADFTGDPITAIGAEETGLKNVWSRWVSNIVYHVGDGEILDSYETSYKEGVGGVTMPSVLVDGNTEFLGWYDNAAFAGEPVIEISADARGQKDYYAKWTSLYMMWDEEKQVLKSSPWGLSDFVTVANNSNAWTDGWYIVNGNVTINTAVNVSGTVNLIIADGATLEAKKGIIVSKNNTLNIYQQALGTGKIIATGDNYSAGIGGARNGSLGTINIYGVNITASGAYGGAGIGGGSGSETGTVNIYAGNINAISARSGAGIGGGSSRSSGIINIYGGTVYAQGDGCGIGSGYNGGDGGTVTIYGGNVTAVSGSGYAAAIGGANSSSASGGDITIYGGYITARAGSYAAAIGGSGYKGGSGGNIKIYGGYVKANGGYSSAGIGGSDTGSAGNVSIYGGYIDATGEGTYGIGAGRNAPVQGTVEIVEGASIVKENNNSHMVVMASVSYKSWNGTEFVDGTVSDYKVVSNTTNTFDNGTYFVFGNTTIEERIVVSGTVNLILCDGATLNASKGITTTGATLNIYTQEKGNGRLIIDSVDDNLAGIGGGANAANGGNVNIYNGYVEVKGGANAAAIGGANGGAGANVNIYNAKVKAVAGANAVAIGAGKGASDNGSLTVGEGLTLTNATQVIEKTGGDYERSEVMNICILSSITYNLNGGTINSGNVTNYVEGSAVTLPSDVTREGYIFLGWYTNSDFKYSAKIELRSDAIGDKVYFAKWKYDFEKAYNECEVGGTIVLLEDLDLSDQASNFLTISKNITIDLNGHILNITSADPSEYIINVANGAVLTFINSSETLGGVIGLCGVDTVSASYVEFKDTRLSSSAQDILDNESAYHIAEGYIILNLEAAPDADGFNAIVRLLNNQDYADMVDALIAAIGEVEYTQESKDKIDSARKGYNDLTDVQKELVASLATLTAAEEKYQALGVIALINAIGEVEYTQESKAKIDAARSAYDALSDAQKAQITNVETLTAAEEQYQVLETIALINAIGEVQYNSESRALIEKARNAYNALSDEQKAQVSVISTLTDAESDYINFATQEINNLIDIEEVTLDNKDDINSAKDVYDALSDEQKAKVPQETVNKLNAAIKEINDIETSNEATEDITELPAVGVLTLDNKDAVEAARNAYNALSDEAKAKVSKETLDKLVAAEQEITDIVAANDASKDITDLPAVGVLTLDNKDAVEAARSAYNALNDYQKSKVSKETLDKLVAAEKEITDIETSNEATEDITELPVVGVLSLDNKDDVEAARSAYNALSDEAKAKVSKETLDKLVAAEKEITDIETSNEATEDITELPVVGVLSLENKADVEAARSAYNALSDEAKSKVSKETLDKLVAAEKEINDIETSNEATEDITDLPAVGVLSLDNKDDVEAARSAYDALSDEAKSKVSKETLDKLAAAEIEITDIEKAKDATDDISELPVVGVLSLENKDDVEAARNAYNALTEYQKQKVSDEVLATLVAAEKEINDIETSNEAIEDITELPAVGVLSLENKADVEAARNAYNALTEYQKQKVSDEVLATLVAAEKEIVDIEESNDVKADINALPELDNISLNNKDAVEAARSAYNALSNEAKAKVSNDVLATLSAIEDLIAELETIVVTPGETTTYTKEIDEKVAETGVNVKELFNQATKGNSTTNEVVIKSGETTVVFDSSAINDIKNNATTFSVKVSEEAEKGQELKIDITLGGSKFENGRAKVSTAFNKKVPFGKKAVVYYLSDDGSKVKMNSWLENGIITFETNHFSTYVVEYKLTGGSIAAIITLSILGALLVAGAVVFVLNKKGIIKLAFLNKKAKAE